MVGLLAEFRAILDAAPGRMSVGRAVHRGPAPGSGIRRPAPPHLRLPADRAALAGRASGRCHRGHRGSLRTRPLAGDRPRQPRPATAGDAAVAWSGGRSRGHRPRRRSPAPDPARHPVPVRRRGDRPGRRARAEVGDAGPAGSSLLAAARLVRPRPLSRPDALDRRPEGGFTTGRPWTRMAPDHATRNVAAQADDPASILALYRRLIWLRKGSAALTTAASAGTCAARMASSPTCASRPMSGCSWPSPRAGVAVWSIWRRSTAVPSASCRATDRRSHRTSPGAASRLRPLEAVVVDLV